MGYRSRPGWQYERLLLRGPDTRYPRPPAAESRVTLRECLVQLLYRLQGGACFYCHCLMTFAPAWAHDWNQRNLDVVAELRLRQATLDHRRPQSWGGGWDVENVVAACKSCNSSKRDRVWLETIGAPARA